MIFTRSLSAALLVFLAACGNGGVQAPPSDWRAALGRGDGIAAEAALRRALDGGEPRGALAPFLGEAALLQGDLGEAGEWLQDGSFAPAVAAHGFHMLGRLRIRAGDLAGAGQAFDRALATKPDDPELWVDIARLRFRGGEQAQAVDASLKALALGPDNPAALLLRAQMVRDAQGNLAALPLLERGLAAAPADPDLLADHAATLGELGRAREMLAAVRRLARAAPGDQRVPYLQAVLATRANRNDLARALLQRSDALTRDMPAATLLLGLVDLDNGNPASAAQAFDRLLRRQPDNLRVQALLAHALAASGNDRELIARFGGELNDRYVALLVGRAHEHLGERDQAARYLDRALAGQGWTRLAALPPSAPLEISSLRAPNDGASAVAVVRGLIRAQRGREARAKAAAWLKQHQGSAEAHALAGDAAVATRDWHGALAHYRASARIRRPWPLTKRMAAALEAAGDPSAAEALVAAHLAGEPNNAEAAAMLARRLKQRDPERARLLQVHAAQGGA